MIKKKEKMYIVKREVLAKNIREAMYKNGKVYAIEEAAPEFQPKEDIKMGFEKK